MSALQTNINTLMNANSVEELRNRMVAILTTLADTPPGSGIAEVTSLDGSITIDNTDPSAPDLSIGYRSYVALLTQTGTSAPTATVLKNDTGLTWVYSYDDEGIYVLTPSVAPNADKTTVIGAYASGSGFIRSMFWRLGVVDIATVDSNNVAVNGVLSNSTIEIRIYP